MSLPDVVRRLSDALAALDEWAKVEVTETGYINRAYRNIHEAYYMLKSLEKIGLPEEKKKNIIEKLKDALVKIGKAIQELRQGRTNPANIYVVSGRKDIDMVTKELVRGHIREARKKLEAVHRLLEEVKRV